MGDPKEPAENPPDLLPKEVILVVPPPGPSPPPPPTDPNLKIVKVVPAKTPKPFALIALLAAQIETLSFALKE